MTASRARSYYLATAIGQVARPQLNGARAADVCVIGAGYTGLSCALHLAKAGLKVVVLEAEVAGFGASGRNGGQVITGQRVDQIELERRYGDAHARALWELALEAKSLVRNLVATHAIDCDLTPGHISAAVRVSHATELESYAEHLAQRYSYSSARFVRAEEMPSLVATENYKGGLYDASSFHLHPLNYALGLARAAESAGVEILEKSAVAEVVPGGKIRVSTSGGTLTANFAVYACNGYLGALSADLARMIQHDHAAQRTFLALLRDNFEGAGFGDPLCLVRCDLRRVRRTAANPAMVKLQFAIAPHIGEGVGRACEADLALRIIGPEAAIEPAARAIAVEHPLGLFRFETDCAAMAGGAHLAHPSALSSSASNSFTCLLINPAAVDALAGRPA